MLRVVNGALAYIYGLLAVMLALTGLALLRFIRIPVPVLHPTARPAQSFIASYVLGLPFGLSTCPACTPAAPRRHGGIRLCRSRHGNGPHGQLRCCPQHSHRDRRNGGGAPCPSQAHAPFHAVGRTGVGAGLIMAAAAYFAYQAALYAGWMLAAAARVRRCRSRHGPSTALHATKMRRRPGRTFQRTDGTFPRCASLSRRCTSRYFRCVLLRALVLIPKARAPSVFLAGKCS